MAPKLWPVVAPLHCIPAAVVAKVVAFLLKVVALLLKVVALKLFLIKMVLALRDESSCEKPQLFCKTDYLMAVNFRNVRGTRGMIHSKCSKRPVGLPPNSNT